MKKFIKTYWVDFSFLILGLFFVAYGCLLCATSNTKENEGILFYSIGILTCCGGGWIVGLVFSNIKK